MTPEEQITRGNRARDILADPLVVEALAFMEQEVVDEWERCPTRDTEGKEFLWILYKNTRKFRGILQGYIERGKLAAHDQKERESFLQTALRAVRR